jgi:actin-related protein 8
MSLSIGGNDVTEFFNVLLERIKFPYRELDLNRSYDWNIMEDLKIRLCTLADVSCRLYLVVFDVSHYTD